MAAVINLETVRMTRNIVNERVTDTGTADIILFPGIRYERWDEDGDSEQELQPSQGRETQQR